MTESAGPEQFRLVAMHVAGRPIDVVEARDGGAAYTDGHVVYVSAAPSAQQRNEMLVQSALLGAGSLDAPLAKALRGRPAMARRYLALEGRRVLAELASELPLAAELDAGEPATSTADESLQIARGRRAVDDAPDWFGVIKPSRLLASPVGPGSKPTDKDLQLKFEVPDVDGEPDDEDDDTGESEDSKILKLFEAPMASRTMSDFLSKLFGSSKSKGQDNAGAEMQIGSVRRVGRVGPDARPLPTQIRFTDDRRPGATLGVGGALHPEWDVFAGRYKEDWCRVIDFPLTAAADVSAAGVPHDDVLRRRLSRIGLGPKILRGRADGDELDIEALIDLFVDLRSGFSPPEHVYLEQRKLSRNLGVLILVDASGSATETDADGLAVHEHQRRAAATMAAVLEELGDRVAVYGFRSQGRHAVHLPAIKPFGHRFGAVGRARLNQLEPSGYTRLGAAIRGAGEILKEQAGTPNRLLLVLSDGFPYDDGYEGRYAEADAHKALEELRMDGVACLCLSIGGASKTEALERVFGSASHASAGTLAELSPRMDQLFLSSLRELAAPKPANR
ncbi:VWA domain-containing protein [Mycobacterium sp. CBMA226]|nr:VWA domain-containing protein [Mycolicibacterium sp. CBMA 226]MUL75830.1 VWA domain-containing protein [Mycolicibacterium sp. CBMA 226]